MDENSRLEEHYSGRSFVYDDDVVGDGGDDDDDVADVEVGQEFGGSGGGEIGSMVLLIQRSKFDRRFLATSQNDKEEQQGCLVDEIPRYLEPNHLGSKLVFHLESKVKGIMIPLWNIGSFFQYIPARLGHNDALDNAIACLCAVYGGTPSSTPYTFQQETYRTYANAISSLRGCLDHQIRQMESETLCASILLQSCEVSFVCFPFPPSFGVSDADG